MTSDQGVVFDLGYQPHEGDRLGRRGAIFATIRDGLRRILGIRRKARKKVMPWLLFGIALLPVVAVVGISFFVDGLFEGIDNPFANHATIFGITAPFFLLFTTMAGPELFIPDRVEGVLSVYASRPIRVSDYLGARATAIAIAAAGFLVVPQFTLYIGLATLDADGWFSGLADNLADVPKFLLASLFFLLAFAAPAMMVAFFAKRLGPAWGVYLLVMALSNLFAELVSTSVSGVWRYVALASLPDNPSIVTDWIFGGSEGITDGVGPMWSVGVILGVAVITWVTGLRRYRSLL